MGREPLDRMECREISCPPGDELADYLAGRLPEERIEQIGEHTENCPRCLKLLSELNDQSDSNIRRVRAGLFSVYGKDAYRRLLQKVDQQFGCDLSRAWDAAQDHSGPSVEFSHNPTIPVRLGQYQLLDVIGQGGMGVVYRARHVSLKSERALKLLRPRRSPNERDRERFRREMEALGKLEHHPNVVIAHDAAEADGFQFLVMEFVDGLSLAQLLAAAGPLSVADACEIARQTAMGLDYAHEHRIVHRDVKPSNLLLTRKGIVKILDLGLASMNQLPNTEQGDNGAIGTSDYMAPEQWRADPEIDTRADIYSLGCTLYQLLTGEAPYRRFRNRGGEKARAHQLEPIPDLCHVRQNVPRELATLVSRTLAKKPQERFQRPSDVAAALSSFCPGSDLERLAVRCSVTQADTESLHSALTSYWEKTGAKLPSRRRFLIAVTGLTCATSVAVASWWPSHNHNWHEMTPTKSLRQRIGSLDPVAQNSGALVIRSASQGLYAMGDAPVAPFQLLTTVKILANTQRAGVFFGFQDSIYSDGSGRLFQLIEFDFNEKLKAYRCNWSSARLDLDPDGPHDVVRYTISPTTFGTDLIPTSILAGQGVLVSIVVEGSGTGRVSIKESQLGDSLVEEPSGTPILELSLDPSNKLRFPCTGACGFFVESGELELARMWARKA